MRIPFGAVTCAWLGLAACSSEAPPGAYLDITNIPANAVEIEVVLAGSAQVVTGQHTGGGFDVVGDATYYAQRGSTGGLATSGKREMVVRVEPSVTNANLTTELTPIVIARSTAGDDSTLVAFGTIPGGDALLTMQLATTTVDEYAASMELAGPIAADAGGLQAGQSETFACAREQLTGFAWRAADGSEIRVVRSMGEPAGDAGNLPLDLDCDGIAATQGDCDDLASTVHPGAAEMCDGIDSDCGQDPVWADPCIVSNPVDTCPTPVGRARCDERIPGETACAEIPTPGCPVGMGPLLICTVGHVGGASVTACSPDVGEVSLPDDLCPNGQCTVDAPAFQGGGWRATVATDPSGPYGARAMTNNQGRFQLQVEQVAGLATGTPLGVVDLFVTAGATAPKYLGVNLGLGADACHAATSGAPSGTFEMRCDVQ